MGLLQQKALDEKASAQKGRSQSGKGAGGLGWTLEQGGRDIAKTAEGWRPPFGAPDHTHTRSGAEAVPLGTLGPQSRVTKAAMRVSGEAFRGKVRHLEGAQVTASPVVYGTNDRPAPAPATARGGQYAFIVDFGGMRSLLAVGFDSGEITMVLPWMGTAFAEKPLFPSSTRAASPTSLVEFAGVDTQKIFVQVVSAQAPDVDDFSSRCSVRTTTVPSNVRASVDDRLPFWTHPGPLTDEVVVTGLLEDLDAALDAMDAPAPVTVNLATDTPGVINVAFSPSTDLKVARTAQASWGGAGELDVEVQALAPAPVTIVWPVPPGARGWLLDELALDVATAFPPWRAFPAQAVDEPGPLGLRVSAQFSVARRITLSDEVLVYGIALPVRAGGDAEVAVELTPGDATAPGTDPPLATATFTAATSSGIAWVEVLFPSPVTVPPGEVWVVAKSRQGAVEWVGAQVAGSDGVTKFSDQGARFEAYPALGGDTVVAQLRLLRAPLPAENLPVVEITAVGGTPATQGVSGDGPAPLTYAFSPARDLAAGSAGVTYDVALLPRSSGTVTLRGATAVYREKP